MIMKAQVAVFQSGAIKTAASQLDSFVARLQRCGADYGAVLLAYRCREGQQGLCQERQGRMRSNPATSPTKPVTRRMTLHLQRFAGVLVCHVTLGHHLSFFSHGSWDSVAPLHKAMYNPAVEFPMLAFSLLHLSVSGSPLTYPPPSLFSTLYTPSTSNIQCLPLPLPPFTCSLPPPFTCPLPLCLTPPSPPPQHEPLWEGACGRPGD